MVDSWIELQLYHHKEIEIIWVFERLSFVIHFELMSIRISFLKYLRLYIANNC